MIKESKRLENITEEQAEMFVKNDMAKYHPYSSDSRCMLIFNRTQNLYHRSSPEKDYRLLKQNFTGQGEEEIKRA